MGDVALYGGDDVRPPAPDWYEVKAQIVCGAIRAYIANPLYGTS